MQDKFSVLKLAKAGTSRSILLSALTSSWELDDAMLARCEVTMYRRAKMQIGAFKNLLKDGTISFLEEPYCVIYRSCTPASLRNYKEVQISYRASPLGNFALVQPVLVYTHMKEHDYE